MNYFRSYFFEANYWDANYFSGQDEGPSPGGIAAGTRAVPITRRRRKPVQVLVPDDDEEFSELLELLTITEEI